MALVEGPRLKGCLLVLAEGPRPKGCLLTSTFRLNSMLENIGCTALGLHPIDSITGNYSCPKLREGRDEKYPHGPLGKEKFYCSRQIPPALNPRNPFPRLFLGRGKTSMSSSGKTWRDTIRIRTQNKRWRSNSPTLSPQNKTNLNLERISRFGTPHIKTRRFQVRSHMRQTWRIKWLQVAHCIFAPTYLIFITFTQQFMPFFDSLQL